MKGEGRPREECWHPDMSLASSGICEEMWDQWHDEGVVIMMDHDPTWVLDIEWWNPQNDVALFGPGGPGKLLYSFSECHSTGPRIESGP